MSVWVLLQVTVLLFLLMGIKTELIDSSIRMSGLSPVEALSASRVSLMLLMASSFFRLMMIGVSGSLVQLVLMLPSISFLASLLLWLLLALAPRENRATLVSAFSPGIELSLLLPPQALRRNTYAAIRESAGFIILPVVKKNGY